MAGRSDINSIMITADDNAADDDSITTAERPNTDATINGADASGGVATFTGGQLINVTTTGTGDSGKTVTITGTDVNGDTQSETITLTGSATGHAGTKFFKTVTAASVSAQPADNIKIGHLATTVKAVIFKGRARIKGVLVVNSATAGTLDFLEGSTTGTSRLQLRSIASANTSRDVTIPEEGIVCVDGAYLSYTSATFAFMTVFFA